jgi:hypothetical protein
MEVSLHECSFLAVRNDCLGLGEPILDVVAVNKSHGINKGECAEAHENEHINQKHWLLVVLVSSVVLY